MRACGCHDSAATILDDNSMIEKTVKQHTNTDYTDKNTMSGYEPIHISSIVK